VATPFRRCSIAIAVEHVAHARKVLERHDCVRPEETRYHSGHLHFTIDLGALPPGDGPAVELVIRREIERR
jgi:hypothetical protein